MLSKITEREFFAIQYPGIVKNDEYAIKSLGGLKDMAQTFESMTNRLRLTFRPQMIYSKPVYGDAKPTTSLLMKVKKLRNRLTGETKVVFENLGVITRIYTFSALADFQYGPYVRLPEDCVATENPVSSYNVFYDDLLIKEPVHALDHYFTKDVPLYVPPVIFTRLDHPVFYDFTSRFRCGDYIEMANMSHEYPYHRKERRSYAVFVSFTDPTPQQAHPQVLADVNSSGPFNRALASAIEQLFQKRPIWSRIGLVYNLRPRVVRLTALKKILPAYSYYMHMGPWSRTWVRFGYDPRKDAESRMYQVVDYRIRSARLIERLTNPALQGQSHNQSISKTKRDKNPYYSEGHYQQHIEPFESGDENGDQFVPGEIISKPNYFLFNRNCWPEIRQIQYQLVDIDLPEVITLLSAPVERTVCHPNDGWLPTGYQRSIRELLSRRLETWLSNKK